MTNQTQINTEVDAMAVLQKLLQFNDLIWTPGIFSDVLGWDLPRVGVALEWLVRNEYVYARLGSYARTEAGREYYESVKHRPDMQTNVNMWKTEALTGVKQGNGKRDCQDWQRSTIKNGVIPKAGNHINYESNPEEVLFEKEEQQQIKLLEKKAAKQLGLGLKKFRQLFVAGLIKRCKGIGKGEHLGRFHKKGKGTQHLCVECMKELRK